MSAPSPPPPPEVRLGEAVAGGLAPAILAIVERGVLRRPELAAAMRAEVELRLDDHPPVRILFGERVVLVEDAAAPGADLRVEGTMSDLASLMAAPLMRGLPNPMDARGRAVLTKVAAGRVRLTGRIGLLRRLLAVIRV